MSRDDLLLKSWRLRGVPATKYRVTFRRPADDRPAARTDRTDRSATVADRRIPRSALARTRPGDLAFRRPTDGGSGGDEDDDNNVLSARRHAAYCSVDCSALASRRRAARPAMRRALHLRNDREPVRRPPAAACLPVCLPPLPPFTEGEIREKRKVVHARDGQSALAKPALARAFRRADRIYFRTPNRALQSELVPRSSDGPLLPVSRANRFRSNLPRDKREEKG